MIPGPKYWGDGSSPFGPTMLAPMPAWQLLTFGDPYRCAGRRLVTVVT